MRRFSASGYCVPRLKIQRISTSSPPTAAGISTEISIFQILDGQMVVRRNNELGCDEQRIVHIRTTHLTTRQARFCTGVAVMFNAAPGAGSCRISGYRGGLMERAGQARVERRLAAILVADIATAG